MLSLLPMWALYILSDMLAFVIHRWARYRLAVVRENLRYSFPHYEAKRLKDIENMYYIHLSDLLVESIKLISMSESELRRHIQVVHPEEIMDLYHTGKNIISVLGHFGNWEWACAAVGAMQPFQPLVVYHPLSNAFWDAKIKEVRTRFGSILIPMQQSYKYLVGYQGKTYFLALLADQSTTRANGYTVQFLNQETYVPKGPEVLSTRLKVPVVYTRVKKLGRGRYLVESELMKVTEGAPEGTLSQLLASKLEADIQATPEAWLWSHKRWKHSRGSKK